jgi:hypothetical protein
MLYFAMIVRLLFIFVPIGLIILQTITFGKGILLSDVDLSSLIRQFFRRILSVMAIFLVFPIASLCMDLVISVTDPNLEHNSTLCAKLVLSKFTNVSNDASALQKSIEENAIRQNYEKKCIKVGNKYVSVSKKLYDSSLSNVTGFLEVDDMVYFCIQGDV